MAAAASRPGLRGLLLLLLLLLLVIFVPLCAARYARA
jgi:hypothetical protein